MCTIADLSARVIAAAVPITMPESIVTVGLVAAGEALIPVTRHAARSWDRNGGFMLIPFLLRARLWQIGGIRRECEVFLFIYCLLKSPEVIGCTPAGKWRDGKGVWGIVLYGR